MASFEAYLILRLCLAKVYGNVSNGRKENWKFEVENFGRQKYRKVKTKLKIEVNVLEDRKPEPSK